MVTNVCYVVLLKNTDCVPIQIENFFMDDVVFLEKNE